MNAKQEVKALVFDAYGTLFDTHSVISLCDQLFPGHGAALSQVWRRKQLEYTWLLSLMDHYKDFWQVTDAALTFACKSLNLRLESQARDRLMEAYLELRPFPEVRQALSKLNNYPLAILSNGSPRMLQAAVKSGEFEGVFSAIISADEVKIYKPSPRVYKLAPEKLGLEPSAIGFVSSNTPKAPSVRRVSLGSCGPRCSHYRPPTHRFFPHSPPRRLALGYWRRLMIRWSLERSAVQSFRA